MIQQPGRWRWLLTISKSFVKNGLDRSGPLGERVASGEQLINTPEGINVRTRVTRTRVTHQAPQTLRGHISTYRRQPRSRTMESSFAGNMKIQDQRLSVVTQQDVGRFQIAMNDAAIVP